MSTSDDAIDGISCSRGLAPFCRQAAAAENKKKLPEDQLLAWIGISKDCDSSCIFNKIGRTERSKEEAIISHEKSNEIIYGQFRDFVEAWTL